MSTLSLSRSLSSFPIFLYLSYTFSLSHGRIQGLDAEILLNKILAPVLIQVKYTSISLCIPILYLLKNSNEKLAPNLFANLELGAKKFCVKSLAPHPTQNPVSALVQALNAMMLVKLKPWTEPLLKGTAS